MRGSAAAALLVLVGCGAPVPRASQVPPRVAGATALGPVAADEPVTFVLAMTLRDRARLDALVAAGATIAPDAFADAFAPPADDYARVVAALRAHELDVFDSPTRTTVTVHGRAADVAAALGTSLWRYADLNGEFRAPGELWLSAETQALVAGAAGLDDAAQWWSHRAAPGTPLPDGASGSLEPADLRAQYDLPANLGDGETIAILGTGLPPSDADIDGYVQKFSLPVNRAQQYARVLVGGPNRDPMGLAQLEYGENLLDADMALAIAPHAKVVHVLTATNSPGLFSDGIVYIVNQLTAAHQVSVSFGTCERVAAGEMLVMNQLFLQAKAEGQQWFFASGDNGTDGCRDGKGNKVLSVNWPASSPYVIAVGGTELDSTNNAEIAWPAGGGGQSEIIDKPAFQTGHTPADGVRDEPDVAAIAGVPGVAIYGQGMLFAGVQGTSVATPVWAAIWALLDEAKGNHAGFGNGAERLYQLGAAGSAALRDVTVGGIGDGTTPGYPAKAGWDFATGWGAPDVSALVTAW
jgi:kumamolisin